MSLHAGDTILNGKYTIQRLLGRGSYGNVWLAVDHLSGGRRVAIKELRHDEVTPEQFADGVKRFQREALIGTQLRHPHIVEVYTVEQVGPDRLLVLEYVDGESLRQRLEREGPLPVAEAVRIAIEVCQALEAVHRHRLGIVHRDVKPSNILLAQDGTARLTDFGIAQLEQEGTERELGAAGHHPGDKLYKSPEQEREFGLLGPASDLYSLGLVLAEMLVGEPYKRLSDRDQHIEERPDIPPTLAPVLMKTLAEKPEARYRNAGEMVTALEAGLEQFRVAHREALYHQGQEALEHSEWETAIHALESLLSEAPDYRDAAALLIQAREGQRQAEYAHRQAEEVQPEVKPPPTAGAKANGCFGCGISTLWVVIVLMSIITTAWWFFLLGHHSSIVIVDSRQAQISANLAVNRGQMVHFLGVGEWTVDAAHFPYVGANGYSPDMDARIGAGQCKQVAQWPFGRLLARVGGNYYGASPFRPDSEGVLYFTANDDCPWDNDGFLLVIVLALPG